jgi:hypothetical protein
MLARMRRASDCARYLFTGRLIAVFLFLFIMPSCLAWFAASAMRRIRLSDFLIPACAKRLPVKIGASA